MRYLTLGEVIELQALGHAAAEVFLVLNGYEINASVDEQEAVMLDVASGLIDRARLADWLERHVARLP